MQAIVYVRVSTQEQAEQGISLDMQEKRGQDAALAAGATSVAVFRDEGYSGTTTARPALQRLLSGLQDVDVVYVWKLSRLSRNLSQLLSMLTIFSEHDVGLVSVTEAFDLSSAFGKAAMHILATFNELQADIIRENVTAALLHRASNLGLPSGGRAYGYTSSVGDQPPGIIPEEAAIVREIFDRYDAGSSLIGLVQWLNGEEIPSRDGKSWFFGTVQGILTNPAYIGKLRYGGAVYDGGQESILNPRLFVSVQQQLSTNARGRQGRRTAKSLGPALCCGTCDGTVGRFTGGSKCYRCRDRLRLPREDRHPPVMNTQHKIDALIWAFVAELIDDDVLTRAGAAVEAEDSQAPITKHQEQLAAVEQQIRYNLAAARAKAVPPELLAEDNRLLMDQRTDLERKIKAAEFTHRPVAPLPADFVMTELATAEVSQQRAFLSDVFSRIELHKRVLTFCFHLPIDPISVEIPRWHRLGAPIKLSLLSTVSLG